VGIVQGGKRKKCRKCGAPLSAGIALTVDTGDQKTATLAQFMQNLTVEQIEQNRPELIDVIITTRSDPPTKALPDPEAVDHAAAYKKLSKKKLIVEIEKRGYEINEEVKKAGKAELIEYLIEDDNETNSEA